MAEVIGGIATSHVPAVGVAIDRHRTQEPYWAPYFAKRIHDLAVRRRVIHEARAAIRAAYCDRGSAEMAF